MEIFCAVSVRVLSFVVSLVPQPIASILVKAAGLVIDPSLRIRHVEIVPIAGGVALIAGFTHLLMLTPTAKFH